MDEGILLGAVQVSGFEKLNFATPATEQLRVAFEAVSV